MLTDYQRQLFSELVSLNWEMSHGDYNPTVKTALLNRYHELTSQLEDSMGRKEWNNFINGMRQMFAPVGGYGDESVEETERMYASI